MKSVYKTILESCKRGKKLFAVLVDPDKFNPQVIEKAEQAKADFIFIGGSKLWNGDFHHCVNAIRKKTKMPLVIFPGSREQISKKADAILLLSLISGRNPDYLIGEHIRAAKKLLRSELEIIPTGYLVVGNGKNISTLSVTKTSPIKNSNLQLAVSTALAGELLGMKLIYLEAGSGNAKTVNQKLLFAVRKNISVPLIAGGGITSAEKAVALCRAGADLVVAGNAIEKDIFLLEKISSAVHSLNQ